MTVWHPKDMVSRLLLTSSLFNVILRMNTDYNDMVKKKRTKNWINSHTKDKYVKLSQSGDYRSRAFYKLYEMRIL